MTDKILQYIAFIRKICDDEKLKPFDRTGIAAVVEYGVRLAGRQKKLYDPFSPHRRPPEGGQLLGREGRKRGREGDPCR